MKFYAFLILILSSFAFSLACYKTYQALTHPIKYENEIETYAEIYNLDCAIVASLINVESSYNPKAKSNKNAIGLMQIKLDTANYLNDLNNTESINEKELFDAETNIKYGCEYLRYLINKFDDINTSIAAYNAGETRVRSWLNNSQYSLDGKTLNQIPYAETKQYINKIKNNLKFYKQVY